MMTRLIIVYKPEIKHDRPDNCVSSDLLTFTKSNIKYAFKLERENNDHFEQS